MSITVVTDTRELERLIRETGGETSYILFDGVDYGIHQEFGTVKMAAHPFFVPAIEHVRPGFAQAFQNKLTNKQVDQVCKKTAYDAEGIAKELAPFDTGLLRNSIGVVKGDKFSFSVGGGE